MRVPSYSRAIGMRAQSDTVRRVEYKILQLMTLDPHEFIRRFLMHVLPQGFHRIRYYGWLTSQTRFKNIARIRELLAVPLIPIDAIKAVNAKPEEPNAPEHPCLCCGGRMRIIEAFLRGQQPKHRPSPVSPKVRI